MARVLHALPNRPTLGLGTTFIGDVEQEIAALAYAAPRDVYFGVTPDATNDRLVTVDAATGMVGILLDGEAKRTIFERCNITLWISYRY